ncbi:MAG: NifB/NifX family molybdenum-iron cluster-binding protein [Candidatus Krumholzibacteriota bacterium]|nr:NifB/NifX family molybdenum-iron cluster-binding protein [Candidatus Krumholzibacteriota bacterium]
MKIAVSAATESEKGQIDSRFGRAKYFILFDTEDERYYALDNRVVVNQNQGAGIMAGEKVADAGVEVVVTGHCGPKAFRLLRAAGIKVMKKEGGTVEEAVSSFLRGDLEVLEGPDVLGHQ